MSWNHLTQDTSGLFWGLYWVAFPKGDFLLDKYQAIAAYSFRALTQKSIGEPAFRGRLDSGTYPEMDFLFTPDGGIDEAALEEFGGYNLLGWTEGSGFSNTLWFKSRISLGATTVSPIGSVAIKIIENNELDEHYIQQLVEARPSIIYTASCYLKAVERTKLRLNIFFPGIQNAVEHFDLSNGRIIPQNDPQVLTAGISSVDDGWYRIYVNTESPSTAVNVGFNIVLVDDNGDSNYLGDNASGLYLAAPQLVKGTQPLDYQPRTDGGAANVYIAKWYDCSENNHDLVQSNFNLQPKIYDVDTGIVKENGKVALEWPNTTNSNSLGVTGNFFSIREVFCVAKFDDSIFNSYEGLFSAAGPTDSDNNGIGLMSESGTVNWFENPGKVWDEIRQNTIVLTSPYSALPGLESQTLINFHATSPFTFNGLTVGKDRQNTNRGWQGTIQEVIIFDSDKTSERTKIENNINNYYGIY